jgi:hypothetical protein
VERSPVAAAALRHQLDLTPRRQVTALGGEQEAAGVPVQGCRDRGLACADTGRAVLVGCALGVAAGHRSLDGLADELERAGGRRMQFAQVLPGIVEGDAGAQPFGEVSVQRARRGQGLELAQGAGGEIGEAGCDSDRRRSVHVE